MPSSPDQPPRRIFQTGSPPSPWSILRRLLLALLPFLFFLARVIEYVWIAGTPEQILWCCHLSNLGLALGLALWRPSWIRLTSLWLIIGLPPWLIDMIMTGLVTPVSIFSHFGGGLVALFVLRHVGLPAGTWRPALLYFLLLQQLTRLLTEPGSYTNVNVAHFAYGPWKEIFQPYWVYLFVSTLLVALSLWLLERVLRRVGFDAAVSRDYAHGKFRRVHLRTSGTTDYGKEEESEAIASPVGEGREGGGQPLP